MTSPRCVCIAASMLCLCFTASVAGARAYSFGAVLAERRAQRLHDNAIKMRERARNAPLGVRMKLMHEANRRRKNALIMEAKARSAQGKGNWSTKFRGLQYKSPTKPPPGSPKHWSNY